MKPLLLAALALAVSPATSAQAEGPSLKERFETLDEAGDHAGVVALWKEHPYEVLYVIDSYLEGSLQIVETEESPDPAVLRSMHERALRGARAADEAFDRGIFTDYAASFVGWNAAEQKNFRAGQAAFGAARQAMGAGDHEAAAAHGAECAALAEPLGDWWGLGMGLSAQGGSLAEAGNAAEALPLLARARHIHHQLGLVGSEYGNLRSMIELCAELGKTDRALVTLDAALALAETLGDGDGAAALRARRAQLSE